jgi:hypothetical protein
MTAKALTALRPGYRLFTGKIDLNKIDIALAEEGVAPDGTSALWLRIVCVVNDDLDPVTGLHGKISQSLPSERRKLGERPVMLGVLRVPKKCRNGEAETAPGIVGAAKTHNQSPKDQNDSTGR